MKNHTNCSFKIKPQYKDSVRHKKFYIQSLTWQYLCQAEVRPINISAYLLRKISFIFIALVTHFNSIGQIVDFDESFNETGFVITPLIANCGVEVLANGSIIVAGEVEGIEGDFALSKYDSMGNVDTTFGTQGIASLNIGNDQAWGIAIQADQKIVIVGRSWTPVLQSCLVVARFNPDGTIDEEFGSNGAVIEAFREKAQANAVLIQPDGKIVVVGETGHPDDSFLIARYNESGSLDSSFNSVGYFMARFGFTPRPEVIIRLGSLALQSDDKIVVSVDLAAQTGSKFGIIRFNKNGTPDYAFGSDGLVITDISESDDNVKIITQSDDKIILIGNSWDILWEDGYITIIRYNPDGTLDNDFGDEGVFKFNSDSVSFKCKDVFMQPDGKIVIVGESDGEIRAFLTIRLTSKGILDTSFNNVGYVLSQIKGSRSQRGNSGAVQKNGKIIISGAWFDPSPPGERSIAVIRYLTELEVGVNDFSNKNVNTLIYPNPINNTATIKYSLEENDKISIEVYDLNGRMIKSLLRNESRFKGENIENLLFGNELQNGNYILNIRNSRSQANIRITKISN